MDKIGLKASEFINVLSWGDISSTQDPKICSERTRLLHDPMLEDILHCHAFVQHYDGQY
jgi:hypothetical protein